MEICNEFVKKPPLLTLPINNAHFVDKLRSTCSSFLRNKELPEELMQTAALLSRLMARRKNSFRRMMGFRAICKLNAALCRLLRVDFARELERFVGTLPDMVVGENGCADVPTRNCLDFVLLRLLSVHQIHQRIVEEAAEAAKYFIMMMRNNFFMEICTLFIAVFAKLKQLSILLGNNYVKLYSVLIQHRERFPQHGNDLLPTASKLPELLESFGALENDNSSSTKQAETIITYQKYDNATKKATPVIHKIQQHCDMGTPIDRESKKTLFDVTQLNTVEEVKRFIIKENTARKKSKLACCTQQISNHEWLGAQKLFERKILANQEKKALIMFRKFISTNV